MFTLKNNGKIALQNNCNCLLEIHLCHLSSHSSRDTVPSNQHLHYAPLPTDPPPSLPPPYFDAVANKGAGMVGGGDVRSRPHTHTCTPSHIRSTNRIQKALHTTCSLFSLLLSDDQYIYIHLEVYSVTRFSSLFRWYNSNQKWPPYSNDQMLYL